MAAYVKDISTNGVSATTSASTLAVPVDVTTTSATDAVVMGIENAGSGVTVSSISDSRGNTWTRAASGAQSHAGSVNNCEIWFTNQNVAQLQAGDTITITYSGAQTSRIAMVQEYTPALAVDKTQNFPSASSTTAMDTGTTVATTQSVEIAIAAYSIAQNLAGWTKNASYTLPTRNFKGDGTSRTLMMSYQILAATGTQDATATAGTAGWSVGVIATFRAATAAPVNTVAPAVTVTATSGHPNVPGAAAVDGQTLSCTSGTWTDDGSPTFTYQWRRAGVNVGGATSSTYVLASADIGSNIDCVVTDNTPDGNTSQASNSVGPVTRQPIGPRMLGYYTQ